MLTPTMRIQLWKLLVGDNDQFISPMILSRVTEFHPQDSAASLFAAALKARPTTGVLKDNRLALRLIDRLRIGVGWNEDLQDLNASFCNDLYEVEALQGGISSTTLLMALLECFDPAEVSVRCTLLHLAARSAHPVPIVADAQGLFPLARGDAAIATGTPPTLLYIGGLSYTVPLAEQNRTVLMLSTRSVFESRRDELLRNLFRLDERLQSRYVDNLNENTIELYVNTPLVKDIETGSTHNCQLFVSNGCWDHHDQLIGALKVMHVIILSLTNEDVADDGSLHDSALQQMVANNKGRVICVFNRSRSDSRGLSRNPIAAEQNLVSRFCEKQHVKGENLITLPENLARTTPDLTHKFQLFTKAIWSMVNHAQGKTGLPVHWLDLQGQLQSLHQKEWLKPCHFAAKVRKQLDNLKVDQKEFKHDLRGDLRNHIFPFSQAAQKAAVKRNKRATKLRRMADPNQAELVEIADQERKDFIKAASANPHQLFLLFLSHLMFSQDMYFFERELEVWKSMGAVANLQNHLENTKKKLDKAMEQRSDVKQLQNNVEAIYAQLDAVDWSTSDFWREIRTIKGLPQRQVLGDQYIARIQIKYKSIFIPMEAPDAISRLFMGLFLRGMTLDILDGNLLSVDEDFLREVFTPRLSQDSLSASLDTSENYFVISMLGVQSTGKSTLLNNLFGCNMPVSAGRTTRGMNVSHVQVSLSNSSIKHIIVQDYEGLMTMDRNDSLFDKDVCLQALATSDIVLVNTSRVIDSPTQQLLQYAAFAFHELGLQKFRKLKPKLAFVLRDMGKADTSAMGPAKRAMEMAIRNGFIETRRMSSNLVLSDVMEVPEYVALASAVHRQDPFWQESLLNLRRFIFKSMIELDKEASQGRCFNNWVVYGVASWDCIRTNTGLLCAKNLAELRLKYQMEEALHEALKSKDTITKSETNAKGLIDSIIESGQTIDEQEIEFQTKLDIEFNQCLQRVTKEFEIRAGGEATIPEPLVETWRDFRNHKIEREVRISKNQMKLKWTERLRIKHTELNMHASVETLLGKICAESSNMGNHKLSQAEAKMHFKELWEPEELRNKSFVEKRHSKEEIKKKVDDIYALVCSKMYIDQPNDFDDLIDSNKEGLTADLTARLTAGVPVDIMKMGSNSGDNVWTLLRPDMWNRQVPHLPVRDVLTDIQNQLCDAISSFSISSSSLQSDIENAVQDINVIIKRVSQNGPADLARDLGTWTSQLAKAAQRHLYRNIIGRIASLSREAKDEQLETLMKLKKELQEYYVAEVTGKLKDLDLYKQITTKLSDALLNMAINPEHLGLQVNVNGAGAESSVLLSHFSISSPEMVEEICYDNLFRRKDDDLLFKYITNRSATTHSAWETQYKIGESAIRNLSYEKVDKIFLGSGCEFNELQTVTEEWFRQNDGKKKVSVKNLLNKLNEQFKFLRIDDHLMPLAISSIDEVRSSMVKSLWPEAATMIERARRDVDRHVKDLRPQIKNLTYGCTEVCPYCSTKCKYPANHVISHECHRHLVTGFGGTSSVYDLGDLNRRSLSTGYCTGSAFDRQWYFDSYKQRGSFYEGLTYDNKNRNPAWKIARETAEIPPLEQREAFMRLNKKIAAHFCLEPADTFW